MLFLRVFVVAALGMLLGCRSSSQADVASGADSSVADSASRGGPGYEDNDAMWQEIPRELPAGLLTGGREWLDAGRGNAPEGGIAPPNCSTDGWCWDYSLSTTIRLSGIWGNSSRDAWAVGSVLLHWDGSNWATVSSSANVTGVWGSGASNVWAVGGSGVWHWDGASWLSETSTAVTAVGGTGADDVWAAGDKGLILHRVGGTWTSMKVATSNPVLSGIYVSAPNDVWTVASYYGLFHWNGSAWTTISSSNSLFEGMWGNASNDIWVVDYKGRQVFHWNGASLSFMTNLGTESLASSSPSAVGGTSGQDVWVVGAPGLIAHWDGKTWEKQSSGTAFTLKGVWATATEVWVVGEGGMILRKKR